MNSSISHLREQLAKTEDRFYVIDTQKKGITSRLESGQFMVLLHPVSKNRILVLSLRCAKSPISVLQRQRMEPLTEEI